MIYKFSEWNISEARTFSDEKFDWIMQNIDTWVANAILSDSNFREAIQVNPEFKVFMQSKRFTIREGDSMEKVVDSLNGLGRYLNQITPALSGKFLTDISKLSPTLKKNISSYGKTTNWGTGKRGRPRKEKPELTLDDIVAKKPGRPKGSKSKKTIQSELSEKQAQLQEKIDSLNKKISDIDDEIEKVDIELKRITASMFAEMKKLNRVKEPLMDEVMELEAEMKSLKNFDGILKENGHYDLVSQFKGDHHGNPLPGKNKFLTSLGLDEEGIETLQVWLNLMTSDENWVEKTYPNGCSYEDVISDISRLVKDLPRFIDYNKSINPVTIAYNLKALIK